MKDEVVAMKTQIKINDLLRIPKEQFGDIRVKFNICSPYENPIEVYKSDPEQINTSWLFWREKRRYYPYPGILAICLVRLSYDTWLLTTIKKVTKLLDVTEGVGYEGEECEKFKSLFGRLILRYHKSAMQGVMKFSTVVDELVIHELLPDTFEGDDFPGYDKVRLTYDQLERIVRNQKRDWVAALENQKAVYLITDTKTGKMYVGSATSENGMLLARWCNYIDSGHGGNVGLKELVEEEGLPYIRQNFVYSILENYNAMVDDQVILSRESWWKDTLLTRQFGYNCN